MSLTKLLKAIRYSLPFSKEKKEQILVDTKEAVDKYLPLIEETFQTPLGEVTVKDYCHLLDDFIEMVYQERHRHFPGQTDEEIREKLSNNHYAIARDNRLGRKHDVSMAYSDSVIYVAFGRTLNGEIAKHGKAGERLNYPGEKAFIEWSTSHELFHHLWHTINSESCMDPRFIFWAEGFASCLGDDLFAKMAFEEYNLPLMASQSSELYRNAKAATTYLIQKYGTEIILEMPKEWQRLDNLLS